MRLNRTICIGLMLGLMPEAAMAAMANEFYTYNGYDPIVSAFQKIALIFSDNSYLAFFTAFAILSMVFSGASAYMKLLGGRQVGPLSWIVPVIGGCVVYLALFVPKTHIEIYDQVTNQTSGSIDNIPVGIVYPAVMLNHIDRVLTDVINSAAPPGKDYTMTAGGISVALLQKGVEHSVKDAQASRTLGEFVTNCVMFELTRPGTGLTMQKLLSPPAGATVLDAMVDAKSPAVMTMSYLAVNEGEAKTCSDAYDAIKTYYTAAANLAPAVTNACAGAGIDAADAGALARCQAILADVAQQTLGSAITASGYVGNATVSTITSDYFRNASGPTAMTFAAASSISSQGSGEGFTSIFNTISRQAYLAYVIALIPVAALFIPTPFCRNALTTIFGLMTWVLVWNVCELMAHQFFMDYFYRTVASLKGSGFGIQSALDIPSYTSVVMGTYGKLKAGAAGFATVLTGGIIKVGGSEMAHFSKNFTGGGVTGSQAGMMNTQTRNTAVAEQIHKDEQTQMARMTSAWSNDHQVGSLDYAAGKAARNIGMAGDGAGRLEVGGSPRGVFDSSSGIGKVNFAQSNAYSRALGSDTAAQHGVVNASQIQGNLSALKDAGGGNYANWAHLNAYNSTMQNTARTATYQDMVNDFGKRMGYDMKTAEGKTMAYKAFAAMDLASSKGTMEAFEVRDSKGNVDADKTVGNYQKFLEMNQHEAKGVQQGKLDAFAQAKGRGFQGDYAAFHEVQSQMASVQGFTNAQANHAIADRHYNGNIMSMFADQARVSMEKAAGHATGIIQQESWAMGKTMRDSLASAGLKQEEIDLAMKGYERNGRAGMEESLGKTTWGRNNESSIAAVAKRAEDAGMKEGIYNVQRATAQQSFAEQGGQAAYFWAQDPADYRTRAANEEAAKLGVSVDSVKDVMSATGMDAREAAAYIDRYNKMDGVAKGRMTEKAADLFAGGHSLDQMMTQFMSRNGVMSGVLTKEGAAALNNKLGHGKQIYKKGDNVSFAVGEDGSVGMAHATRGGFAHDKNGRTKETLDNKRKDTSDITDSRRLSYSGFGTYNIAERQNKGVFEVKGADGKMVSYEGQWNYDSKGNLVSSMYKNTQTGDVVGMQQVKVGDKTVEQWGILREQQGAGGKGRVWEFKALSHAEVDKNGYATQQTLSNGKVIMERNDAGQATYSWDSFHGDKQRDISRSLVPVVWDDTDKTTLSSAQLIMLDTIGGAKTGIDAGLTGVNLKKGWEAANAEGQAAARETMRAETRAAEQAARESARAAEAAAREKAAALRAAQQKTSATLKNQSSKSQLPSIKPAPNKNINRGGPSRPPSRPRNAGL